MKRLFIACAIVVAVVLVVVIALPFFVNANRFRPLLESRLGAALGRQVKLGDVSLALFSGGLKASDISIGDNPRFSSGAFVSAESLAIGVDLPALIFSRELHAKSILLDQPSITLLQDPKGAWNFSSFGPATPSGTQEPSGEAAALELSVQSLKVTGGKIVLAKTQSKTKPEVFGNVTMEVDGFSAGAAFPFAISATGSGGAVIQLSGKAGPLNSSDLAATPVQAKVNVTHLDLARSGFLPATGFAGLVSLNGDLTSSGSQARLQGSFEAAQLVLARNGTPAKKPVSFNFDLRHDVEKHAGTLERGAVRIGAAQASLTGTYRSEGEATILNVKLSGPAMPVPDLEAMLPALDIILPAGASFQGGTASANVTIVGPTDRLVLDGTLGLNNTRLSGFDLGSKIAFMEKVAGMKEGLSTEIQSMSMNIHIDPDGVRTENVALEAPQIGSLTGAGTVSAAHALNFAMVAKVHTGGVLEMLGPNSTVPFKIVGTSTEPRFEPDLKGIAVDKLKQLGGTDVKKAAGEILKGFLGGKK